MIRRITLTLLALALAACGTAVTQGTPLGQTIASLSAPDPDPRFVALRDNGAPQLQVGIINSQSNSTLLREAQSGDFTYWLSVNGTQLILQRGMLHGTRGLGGGLLASDLSGPLALVLDRRNGQTDRLQTYLDGNDRAVTRTYRCLITAGALVDVTLGNGATEPTRQMTEDCRNPDQSFRNIYWVSQDRAAIVQSRQWAGPVVGPVSTRIMQ